MYDENPLLACYMRFEFVFDTSFRADTLKWSRGQAVDTAGRLTPGCFWIGVPDPDWRCARVHLPQLRTAIKKLKKNLINKKKVEYSGREKGLGSKYALAYRGTDATSENCPKASPTGTRVHLSELTLSKETSIVWLVHRSFWMSILRHMYLCVALELMRNRILLVKYPNSNEFLVRRKVDVCKTVCTVLPNAGKKIEMAKSWNSM
jgi:hypothetical protein